MVAVAGVIAPFGAGVLLRVSWLLITETGLAQVALLVISTVMISPVASALVEKVAAFVPIGAPFFRHW
jgi:hypothetical protein